MDKGDYRIIEERLVDDDKMFIVAFGKSGTTMPSGNLATGSTAIEIDTGKAYFYDEATSDWIEQ